MNGGIHKTEKRISPISPTSSFRRQELRRIGEAAKNKADGKPELAESQSKSGKGRGSSPSEDQEFERCCQKFWGTKSKPRTHRKLGDTPPYARPTKGKGVRLRTLGDTPPLADERGTHKSAPKKRLEKEFPL